VLKVILEEKERAKAEGARAAAAAAAAAEKPHGVERTPGAEGTPVRMCVCMYVSVLCQLS
jgi:hypothetical protein